MINLKLARVTSILGLVKFSIIKRAPPEGPQPMHQRWPHAAFAPQTACV